MFFAERKFYNHCNTMEIDMTDIARGEKAPLAAKLLNKFTVIDSNIHNLPFSIGLLLLNRLNLLETTLLIYVYLFMFMYLYMHTCKRPHH